MGWGEVCMGRRWVGRGCVPIEMGLIFKHSPRRRWVKGANGDMEQMWVGRGRVPIEMGLIFKHSPRRRWVKGADGDREQMWVGKKTFPEEKMFLRGKMCPCRWIVVGEELLP